MSDHRFIAAMDHSGGSTGGVLERYGQEYTEENKMQLVNKMRLRMVNSPDFNDSNIWGAILYQDSYVKMLHNTIHSKGIVTFLKVDGGLAEDGTLKEFDLDAMIEFAKQPHINAYGTKMRSVIKHTSLVEKVLEQQFAFATKIDAAGLVPIIEPEVPIDHPEKEQIESELRYRLFEFLDNYNGRCILKLTPPEVPNAYYDFVGHPNVSKVVFLSGGYSTNEACNRLGLNDGVSASFSRALSQDLYYNLTDEEFNATISNNIRLITEASE